MSRKSRRILTAILLCVVIGGGILFLTARGGKEGQNREEIPPEIQAEILGEDTSTPAAVENQNKAGDPRVTIACEIPKTPEKMEIISWEYMDLTKEQEYLEGLLKDNPENKAYRLIPRVGGNDFHHSKEDPYMCWYMGDRAGISMKKNTKDGMSADRSFSKEQVVKKISRILEHLSQTAEPVEQWQIEKNGPVSFEVGAQKNYTVSMYPACNGWPLLYTMYSYEVDEGVYDSINPWEFCYSDIGWMEIFLDGCMEMKATGRYVDIMPLEEATVFLAERVGEYYIRKISFGYWYGKDHTLRPYWYVQKGEEHMMGNAYCIDAATGEIYGPEEAPEFQDFLGGGFHIENE